MITVWTHADRVGRGLPRFTPPRTTACVSLGALCRWSERVVWGHCGEAMASTSSKSRQSLQLSSWPMNRYVTLQLQWANYVSRLCCCVTNVVCQIKRLIGSNQETLGIAERLVAGSLAGTISQSSIYPMEVRVLWTQREYKKQEKSVIKIIFIQ